MYEQFVIGMVETTDGQETWKLRKTDLKVETEALLFTAQEQAIRTNHVKHKIDKTDEPPLRRMYGKKSKAKLTQRVNAKSWQKRKHDNVVRVVHWKLCDEI